MLVQRYVREKVKQKERVMIFNSFWNIFLSVFFCCLLTLCYFLYYTPFFLSLLLRLDYTRTYKHITLLNRLTIKSGRWKYILSWILDIHFDRSKIFIKYSSLPNTNRKHHSSLYVYYIREEERKQERERERKNKRIKKRTWTKHNICVIE